MPTAPTVPSFPPCSWLLIGALSVAGASCGFGTASVVAAAGGGGGATNAPSTPGSLLVLDAKTSPARIRLVLTDAEDDAATVEFFYVLPHAPGVEHSLRHLASNPVKLAASRGGTTHDLPWDFAAETGLPADASFVAGVTLIARIVGGTTQSTVVGLGNDAPVVDQIGVPPIEVSGIALVSFRIADSSGDSVDVDAEFFDLDDPAAGWRPARAAGSPATAGNEAFRGVVAPPGGTTLTFFWDTDSRTGSGQPLGDLVDLERDVRLRFTARDSVVAQAPAASGTFHIDNNDLPAAQLDEGVVVTSSDRVGGIPIAYRAFDDEGDPVSVVFQWRHVDQAQFPDLGTKKRTELASLLRDPQFRREKQVCTAVQQQETGTVQPVAADRIRLGELLAGAMADTHAGGVVDRELEVMRPPAGPATALAAGWSQNPLLAPVGALALDDAGTVVVLDDRGGAGTLFEIEPGTGALVRTIATLAGQPTALAFTQQRDGVLVAMNPGSGWQLFEVALSTGAAVLRVEQGTSGLTGPLKGLAARSTRSGLATAGDNLLELAWPASGTGSARVVVGGLADPRGLAFDARVEGVCFVAERAAAGASGPGRVTLVHLDHRTIEPLAGLSVSMPQPIDVEFAADATTLHVLCQPVGQPPAVVMVPYGRAAPSRTTTVPAQATSVATGRDNLVLVAVRSAPDLAVLGGVEQRRRVVAYDPRTAIATVDAPFVPPARTNTTWRLRARDPFFAPTSGSAAGTPARFVWDSSDGPAGDGVFLRATPVDTEAGLPDASSGALVLSSRLATTPRSLPVGASRDGVAIGDLDRDGDQDLVVAQGAGPTILTQSTPGQFTVGLTLSTAGHGAPGSVAIADMNGDGRLDIVAGLTNPSFNGEVAIYLQNAAGAFPGPPVFVGVGLGLPGGRKVVVGDCDADGRPDLLLSTFFQVFVFFQTAPLVFGAPEVLSPSTQQVTDFVAADFDADGRLEVAVNGKNTPDIPPFGVTVLFRQPTPRTFAVLDLINLGRLASSLAAGDADADGDIDLAVATNDPDGGSLRVLLQTGNGIFSQAGTGQFLSDTSFATSLDDLEFADADGDGDLDLIGVSPAQDVTVVLPQIATGLFDQHPLRLGAVLGEAGVTAGDVDGDGNVDLLVATGGSLLAYTHDVADSLADREVVLGGPSSTSSAAVLAVGHLDGDRLGLMTTHFPGGGQQTFLTSLSQLASGEFGAPSTFLGPSTTGTYTNLLGYDLDGDLDTDVVCTPAAGIHQVVLLRQTSAGAFTEIPAFDGNNVPPGRALVSDLDQDGDADVLAGVHALLQDATGTFVDAGVLPLTAPLPVLADLDGDGDTDIGCAGNSFQFLRQTSPGVFAVDSVIVGLGATANVVAAGDLDGDGDTDLALGTTTSLVILFQGAPGAFGTPTVISGAPSSVAIGDIDGDGWNDVVAGAGSGFDVLRQVAPGRFAPLVRRPGAGATLTNLVVVDVDFDGALDVASTRNSQNVAVHFGGR